LHLLENNETFLFEKLRVVSSENDSFLIKISTDQRFLNKTLSKVFGNNFKMEKSNPELPRNLSS
jgi:hypothetical protein